ncbi:Mitochondrial pyruvate carrier 4 [Linum perenne]
MAITPKNLNLFSVNVCLAGTGIYQMYRKIK